MGMHLPAYVNQRPALARMTQTDVFSVDGSYFSDTPELTCHRFKNIAFQPLKA
jgi:hypothetical protein